MCVSGPCLLRPEIPPTLWTDSEEPLLSGRSLSRSLHQRPPSRTLRYLAFVCSHMSEERDTPSVEHGGNPRSGQESCRKYLGTADGSLLRSRYCDLALVQPGIGHFVSSIHHHISNSPHVSMAVDEPTKCANRIMNRLLETTPFLRDEQAASICQDPVSKSSPKTHHKSNLQTYVSCKTKTRSSSLRETPSSAEAGGPRRPVTGDSCFPWASASCRLPRISWRTPRRCSPPPGTGSPGA